MFIDRKKSILLSIIGLSLCLTGCCDHVWTEATCASPKTCAECGATRGDVVHKWINATCTSPKTCSKCGVTEGNVVHDWADATCTTPQTCNLCGATQGGLAETHIWVDATCTTPKTCSECGVTEGDVVHTFEIVKCDEPSVCSGCGATGEIVEHTWIDATCEKPKMCEVCGKAEGESLGHVVTHGECNRCGQYITDIYAPLSSTDCRFKPVLDIINAFEDSGFINIEIYAEDHSFGGEYKDDDVVKVLINGVEVDATTIYKDDDLVEIFYARVPFAQEATFGTYEQDCKSSTKDSIIWYVVKIEDDKCLLVSKEILDYLPFNDTTIATGTSWKNSSLRKWLNGTFYDSAFTQAEKNLICITNVQDYKADKKLGDITTDKVFILSYDEAWTYFPNGYRSSSLTEYAERRKEIHSSTWWLINSYSSDLYKYVVNAWGQHENSPRVNES